MIISLKRSRVLGSRPKRLPSCSPFPFCYRCVTNPHLWVRPFVKECETHAPFCSFAPSFHALPVAVHASLRSFMLQITRQPLPSFLFSAYPCNFTRSASSASSSYIRGTFDQRSEKPTSSPWRRRPRPATPPPPHRINTSWL